MERVQFLSERQRVKFTRREKALFYTKKKGQIINFVVGGLVQLMILLTFFLLQCVYFSSIFSGRKGAMLLLGKNGY